MKLYHVTRKENYAKIMEQGLLPMIDGNSSANAEEESCIYLCKRKDVGYWKIILQCPVVLQVSGISPDECEHFEYSITENTCVEKQSVQSRLRSYISKPLKNR